MSLNAATQTPAQTPDETPGRANLQPGGDLENPTYLETEKRVDEQMAALKREIDERECVEQELRASNEKMRAMFASIPDGITFTDLQGNIVDLNEAALHMHGFQNKDEVLGRNAIEMIAAPDRQRALRNLEKTLESGNSGQLEYRFLTWDGREFDAELSAVLLRDEQGDPAGLVAITRDITGRKQVQKLLAASEKRYRDFVELSVDGVWLLGFDEPIGLDLPEEEQVRQIQGRGYVAECNDALARMYGYAARAEMVGMRLMDLYGGESSQVNFEATLQLAREGYRSANRLTEEYNAQGERVYFLNNAVGVIQDGQLVGLWGTQRDITELRRAEYALRANEQRYRALFERTNDAVFLISLDGYHIAANQQAASMLGYTMQEVVGLPIQAVIASREYSESQDKFNGLLEGEIFPVYERIFRRKDGSEFPVEIDAALVCDDEGNPLHIQSIVRDITERKRHEDEIRQAKENLELRVRERTAELTSTVTELENFSYTISHNLRAPLRAMNGYASLLGQEQKEQLDPATLKYLERIQENARLMGQMIDELLQFQRLNRIPVVKQEVDTAELVQDVLHSFGPECEIRGAEIVVGDLPPCQADLALLRLVYENLFENALKFTRPRRPARIEVGWQRLEAEAAYFVRDNGVGLEMQYASRLFGAFERLHASDGYEGTGMGLAIVQRIIQRHGGSVWAEGSPDQGATFFFTLPPPERGGQSSRAA